MSITTYHHTTLCRQVKPSRVYERIIFNPEQIQGDFEKKEPSNTDIKVSNLFFLHI